MRTSESRSQSTLHFANLNRKSIRTSQEVHRTGICTSQWRPEDFKIQHSHRHGTSRQLATATPAHRKVCSISLLLTCSISAARMSAWGSMLHIVSSPSPEKETLPRVSTAERSVVRVRCCTREKPSTSSCNFTRFHVASSSMPGDLEQGRSGAGRVC